jgi:predicted acyltransferase
LTKSFIIFGTNAIAAYVLSELVGLPFRWLDYIFQLPFARAVSPAMASLLYSLTIVGLCFLPVWWMYRRKIFLKV